jgi:hypothetical protein
MKRILGAAALAAALVAGVPATPHHSYAMFDQSKEIELKNVTVKDWQWTNPHTWLFVYVPNGTADPDKYALEGGNPAQLRRQGYGVGSMKSGDKLTVYIAPLKSGEKGGALLAVILPDGKMLGARLASRQVSE